MLQASLRCGLVWLVLGVVSFAQPWRQYRLSEVAGVNIQPLGATAVEAYLPNITALCYGPDGLLYFGSDSFGLLRINAQGVIEQVFTDAVFSPCAIAPNGGIYSPAFSQVIYRNPGGILRRISLAGPWGSGFASGGVAPSQEGGAFIADQSRNRIFRIGPGGDVSIHVGLGSASGATLQTSPNRLATDGGNNLYATSNSGRLVQVGPSNVIWTHSGPLGDIAIAKSGDIYVVGTGANAGVYRIRRGSEAVLVLPGISPRFIAMDPQDRLVYTSSDQRAVFRLETSGGITRLAGLDPADGSGGNVSILSPRVLALGQGDDFYVADIGSFRILKLRRRDGQSASLIAETRTQSRPDLLARDRQGTIYFAASSGNEVFRFRDGEAPVSHTRDISGIQGLAARDGNLVVSTGDASGLWTVDHAGTAKPLQLRGQAPQLVPMYQMATTANGDIFALVDRQVWRINRENELTRGETGRYGDAAAALACAPGPRNAPVAVVGEAALWFQGNNGLCQLDANGRIWFVEERQTVVESPGGLGARNIAGFQFLGGMVTDDQGKLILSESRSEKVWQLELVSEGVPFALQPEVEAVRGAGGSTSPALAELSPGGLISIFGRNFAPVGTARAVGAADLKDGKLPLNFAATCVRISGQLAPLTYVGESQINAQVPNLLLGNTGVTVVANCQAELEFESSPLYSTTNQTTPEFLYWVNRGAGNNPVVAVEARSGAFLGPTNLLPGLNFRPARSGEVVTVYAVGFGPTTPNPEPGAAVDGAAPTRASAFLFLGGEQVGPGNVLYVGASPGIAGLYQVNFRIPQVTNGEKKLRIQVGSYTSPSDGYLWIQN